MLCLATAADSSSWLYILCIAAAMFITGLGKAGFGGGVGLVVTPLMAMVVAPSPRVLAMTLPAFVLGDICSLLWQKREYEPPLLRLLLPAAAAGVALGAVALKIMQISFAQQQVTLSNVLALMIGSVSLSIIIMQLWRMLGGRTFQIPTGPAMTVGVGVFEAFLSTLTNSAGVLMALLLLNKKLSKAHYMSTVLTFFMVVNAGKFGAYVVLNELITWETLGAIAPFLPLVVVGVAAGAWLNRRIDAKVFTLVLYGLAAAAAARMIWKVFA